MGCGASAPQEKPEEKAPVEVEQWNLGRNVEFENLCDCILIILCVIIPVAKEEGISGRKRLQT